MLCSARLDCRASARGLPPAWPGADSAVRPPTHLLPALLPTPPPQGHGGWLLPILTATWGTALLASMAGLAAPEATALLEQAEAEAAATAASE